MKNIDRRLNTLESRTPPGPIWCRVVYHDALTGETFPGPLFDITKPAPPEVIEYRKTLTGPAQGDDDEKPA